jgi:hypothetical protein
LIARARDEPALVDAADPVGQPVRVVARPDEKTGADDEGTVAEAVEGDEFAFALERTVGRTV